MKKSDLYIGFRYPAEIISHAVYVPEEVLTGHPLNKSRGCWFSSS